MFAQIQIWNFTLSPVLVLVTLVVGGSAGFIRGCSSMSGGFITRGFVWYFSEVTRNLKQSGGGVVEWEQGGGGLVWWEWIRDGGGGEIWVMQFCSCACASVSVCDYGGQERFRSVGAENLSSLSSSSSFSFCHRARRTATAICAISQLTGFKKNSASLILRKEEKRGEMEG